ncbi:MAG: STAS domain-containing protein [Blastocatellia bacterium]
MLRIDIRRDGSATAFVLEGKLVGPWVAELENCWNESAAGVASQISVDLTGVSFIDSKGRDLLAQMRRQGAKLAASGCLTMAIVNAIEKDIETEAGRIDISGSDCECEPN